MMIPVAAIAQSLGDAFLIGMLCAAFTGAFSVRMWDYLADSPWRFRRWRRFKAGQRRRAARMARA